MNTITTINSNQWTNFPVMPGTDRMHVQYDASLTHAVPIYQYKYADNLGQQFVSAARQILAGQGICMLSLKKLTTSIHGKERLIRLNKS